MAGGLGEPQKVLQLLGRSPRLDGDAAWGDWVNDWFWMTSYFSAGVWGAFLMVWTVPHYE